jgi:hypothetical protein
MMVAFLSPLRRSFRRAGDCTDERSIDATVSALDSVIWDGRYDFFSTTLHCMFRVQNFLARVFYPALDTLSRDSRGGEKNLSGIPASIEPDDGRAGGAPEEAPHGP